MRVVKIMDAAVMDVPVPQCQEDIVKVITVIPKDCFSVRIF